MKELLHRQDILEKSHKQQLIAEMKKKKEVKRQLVAAEARIKTLEGLVVEKDKQINRLYNVHNNINHHHLGCTSTLGDKASEELPP